MNPGDNSKMGIDNIDSMIDQAIDDLFVPSKPAQAPAQAAPPPPPPPSEAKEPEKSAGLDLEISWDKPAAAPAAAPPPPPAPEPEEGPLLFTEPVRQERPAAARAAPPPSDDSDEEDEAPKMTILRPLYEKLLSLDWEITSSNIAAVEQALADLSAQTSGNMYAQTGIKMTAVCCKYLRASKTLASPLAMKFLRASLSALDIFLQPPAPGRPSKDALVNELMGLYNDMKEDANRLRAAALRQRQAAPAPAAPGASLAALASLAQDGGDLKTKLANVKAALANLLAAVEEIEKSL